MVEKSFPSLTLYPLSCCFLASVSQLNVEINELQNKLSNHCDLMVPKALWMWSRGKEILFCKAPKATSPLLRGTDPFHHLLSQPGTCMAACARAVPAGRREGFAEVGQHLLSWGRRSRIS